MNLEYYYLSVIKLYGLLQASYLLYSVQLSLLEILKKEHEHGTNQYCCIV